MKTIQGVALLGAALIAACSGRQSVTAPAADTAALGLAESTGGLNYKWSLTCKTTAGYPGYLTASWFWTENGVAITETEQQGCNASLGKATGSGVRPATANGFSACFAPAANCQSWSSWTFDPSGRFTARLDYSTQQLGCKSFTGPCRWFTLSGTLTVAS
jgi:hypothetical protein